MSEEIQVQIEDKQDQIADKIEDTEEKEADQKDKLNKLAEMEKSIDTIKAERLKNVEEELKIIEKRIENKIEDFKTFIDKTAVQGRSLSQPPKTDEQQAWDDAEQLIKGTGLKITRPDDQ